MATTLRSQLLSSLAVLRTQILAALSVPLEEDDRPSSRKCDRFFDDERFEENAGRIGRNGVGSLEVGGGDDWFDR